MKQEDLDWAAAEKEFEEFFPGKRSFVYAFEDTKEAMKNGGVRKVFTKARPSDYLVTHDGKTFFAEVKYTTKDRFNFAAIRPGQFACAYQCVLAGGLYFFFVKSGTTQIWYRIPAAVILDTFPVKKSLRWDELEPYVYNGN